MAENESKVDRRQAGIGLAFLGIMVLVLAGFFYILSWLQPDSFHLFAGSNHLGFNLVLGSVFLAAGLIILKTGSAPKRSDTPPKT